MPTTTPAETPGGPASALIFADASGLIAYTLASDPDHSAAVAETHRRLRAGRRFLTTNYVFDEVVTRVRRVAGFLDARRAGDWILSSKVIQRYYIGVIMEARAWESHLKFHDQDFSFTDVTSMTVMARYGITEVLTFDSDFVRAGFTMLPGDRKSR